MHGQRQVNVRIGTALLVAALLLLGHGARAGILYSYDPAETYGGHSWSSRGGGMAALFTMPVDADAYVLEEISIRISYTNEAVTPIALGLWEDAGGAPGALLWSQGEPDVNGPTTDASSYWWWNTFLVADVLLFAPGTSFFVGFTSGDYPDIAPSWRANISTMNGILGSWQYEQDFFTGEWEWVEKTYDRMIQLRVVAVPEPGCFLFVAMSFGGSLLRRRRRVG